MKPFENAFENVQDELAKMLEEGKFSFESLAKIAKKMAAEVAAAWIIRPMLSAAIGAPSGFGGAGGGFDIGGLASMGQLTNQNIASMGQASGARQAAAGQQTAANISNLMGTQGAAQAGGILGQQSALSGGINQAFGAIQGAGGFGNLFGRTPAPAFNAPGQGFFSGAQSGDVGF
jgi:hypothetical protein